jgi:hypothetical protein
MESKKPMKILNFRARPRLAAPLRGNLASIEVLLAECRGRQSALREDGRRLHKSLKRLSLLTEDVIRGSERLRSALGRLSARHPAPGAQKPRG